jgi:hypothetical protein
MSKLSDVFAKLSNKVKPATGLKTSQNVLSGKKAERVVAANLLQKSKRNEKFQQQRGLEASANSKENGKKNKSKKGSIDLVNHNAMILMAHSQFD